MVNKQVRAIPDGAILFDAAAFDAGAVPAPDARWFDAAWWSVQGKSELRSAAGRGGVAFVQTPLGWCVLRHYHRGGLAAVASADRYVWTGAARSRSFREFELSSRLLHLGLPVPEPIAARCVREALTYRADLLIRRLPGVQTLAEALATGSLDASVASRVGRTLARFHSVGVWHADLNAHNVLLGDLSAGNTATDAVWLIDFDRGRLRKPALAWQESNLMRLRRSFVKLGALSSTGDFDSGFWHPLLAEYHARLATGANVRSNDGAAR